MLFYSVLLFLFFNYSFAHNLLAPLSRNPDLCLFQHFLMHLLFWSNWVSGFSGFLPPPQDSPSGHADHNSIWIIDEPFRPKTIVLPWISQLAQGGGVIIFKHICSLLLAGRTSVVPLPDFCWANSFKDLWMMEEQC